MSVALAVALLAVSPVRAPSRSSPSTPASARSSRPRGRAVRVRQRLVGRPAPVAVRPRPGEQVAVVAVLDGDCALCRAVWQAMGEAHHEDAVIGGVQYVGLVDRAADVPAPGGCAELVVDDQARADLFEGYAPTVLTVDAKGTVTGRLRLPRHRPAALAEGPPTFEGRR